MTPLNSIKNSIWQITLLAVLSVSVGCQSARFQAGSLPAQYRVGSKKAKQKINLAQVASPGANSSLLSPGDLLEITVASGQADEESTPVVVRVSDDGMVDVPVVGPVPVSGLEAFDASQNITRLAIERGMYLHPRVMVEMKTKAVNRITVLGAVQDPAVHEIYRGNSDLISAIAAAGGLNDEADTIVEIIRQPQYVEGLAASDASKDPNSKEVQLASYQNAGQFLQGNPNNATQLGGWQPPRVVRVDLANANAVGNPDYRLMDRDIVRVVPRKKKHIYVAGLVNEPGQFDLPLDEDVHLLDAIALAGGRSSVVGNKIFVIRHIEGQEEPVVIQASLSKAKHNGLENLRLMAGDTVSIEQTPVTTVVDTMSKFFHMSFGVASGRVF